MHTVHDDVCVRKQCNCCGDVGLEGTGFSQRSADMDAGSEGAERAPETRHY